jgi:hypothetical protein
MGISRFTRYQFGNFGDSQKYAILPNIGIFAYHEHAWAWMGIHGHGTSWHLMGMHGHVS